MTQVIDNTTFKQKQQYLRGLHEELNSLGWDIEHADMYINAVVAEKLGMKNKVSMIACGISFTAAAVTGAVATIGVTLHGQDSPTAIQAAQFFVHASTGLITGILWKNTEHQIKGVYQETVTAASNAAKPVRLPSATPSF